jgi:hypothetical protein
VGGKTVIAAVFQIENIHARFRIAQGREPISSTSDIPPQLPRDAEPAEFRKSLYSGLFRYFPLIDF